jgi:hypothetical protein
VAGVSATPTRSPIPPTSAPTATHTPPPTGTPTIPPTATPTPLPTETPDLAATIDARLRATSEAALNDRLEEYGIDPSAGRFVLENHKPIRMELTSFLENSNRVLDEAGSLADFVVESNITWTTSGGLALCGITFHAEEDLAEGAQNRFFMMRLQYSPAWTIWHWEYGEFQYFVNDGWLASRDIHDENDSTNRVALVVQGKDIDIFLNGDKQRRVEETTLTEGLLALSAFQESGRTVCTFEDTWVWVFEP